MIFDVRVHEEYIYIIPSKDNTLVRSSLRIDRRNKRIEEQLQVKFEGKFIGSKSIAYLMGIFKYQKHSFIAIVDQKDRVASIGQQRIYRIKSISYIQIEQERLGTDVYATLHGQKELMTRYGFYYSINGDITQAKQYQKHEDSFCWNYTLLNYIQENGLSQQWYFPIIQGFVEQIETVIDNQLIHVILISRRSRYMGGTRYNSRGINDEGHVANFNETEQILIINNFIFSFVSVRGSAPLFWQQDNNMSVKLSRSLDLTITAFQKHFEQLISRYGFICCVNLMAKDRDLEQQLSSGFQELILRYQNNKVKYAHIDFHSLVKQGSSQRLNPTIYDFKQMINETFQFYLQDNIQQKGIFRINCLDCLDRTNLYMSKIYFYILNFQLKTLGFKLSGNDEILDLFDENNKKLQSDLVIKFKSLWANNGDMISQIYAGTDSTVSQMIRDGKQNLFGMLVQGYRNAERMYNSKFEDETKQSSINALIQEQKSQDQGIIQSNLNIHAITWNVGGRLPQQENFLQTLLNFQELQNPDIIVFGIQEIVNLNPQNVMVLSNDKNKLIWNNLFQSNLQQIDKYLLLAEADLIGIQLQIYIKDNIKHRVSKIETDIIKTGMNGILGNKGGVIVKFNIDDSQLSIINCHLTSGQGQLVDRLRDIQDIHEKAFSQSKNNSILKDNDYCFFLGDMNFRIDLQYQEVIDKTFQYQQLINQDDQKSQKARQILQYLLNNDQLIKVKNDHYILKQYNEGGIDFLPTYKYDQYSNVYDTSKKRRIPSWCDRILVKSKEDLILQQHFYSRRECLDSDHRPVTSYYTIEVKKHQKLQQTQPVQYKPQLQQQQQPQQYQFQQIDLL